MLLAIIIPHYFKSNEKWTTHLPTPPCIIQILINLLCHGVAGDVFSGVLNTQNLVRFCIRNFNCEFILNGHYNFNRIKRIKTEVISKFSTRCNFRWINFVEIFDNCYDTVGNLLWVEKSLFASRYNQITIFIQKGWNIFTIHLHYRRSFEGAKVAGEEQRGKECEEQTEKWRRTWLY